jgi:hypothetical protein
MFRYFFLRSNHVKQHISAWEEFLFQVDFRVLGRFFGFYVAMDWFNKVFMVFSRCFW